MVDNEILSILRARFEDCVLYEAPDHMTKCLPFKEAYEKGAENWFTKCNASAFLCLYSLINIFFKNHY